MPVALVVVSPHINRTVAKTPYMLRVQIYNKACCMKNFYNNCVKKEKKSIKSFPLYKSKRGANGAIFHRFS